MDKMNVKSTNYKNLRDVDQKELDNINGIVNDAQKKYDELEAEIRALRDRLSNTGNADSTYPPAEPSVINPYSKI